MIVCGIVGISAMNTRRTLPKPLCSIRAPASFLADSQILNGDFIPAGSDWWSDREARMCGLFDGRTFTMGFWDDYNTPKDSLQANESTGTTSAADDPISIKNRNFGVDIDPERWLVYHHS
ncbi:hypothetical protein FQN57_000816 [Myotisia sp. PD_48]|nr:hypothetical protein FQN57_000816 [Myotisia sp. PD_48]